MLPKEFYLQLLDLEDKIQSHKHITIDKINQLVDKYASCVEYFDTIADPIKIYFLEKIQITLANTKFLNVLVKNNSEQNDQTFVLSENPNTQTHINSRNNNQYIQKYEKQYMSSYFPFLMSQVKQFEQANQSQNIRRFEQDSIIEEDRVLESVKVIEQAKYCNQQFDGKDKRFIKQNQELQNGIFDEIMNEYIETQPTERGEDQDQVKMLDTLEDIGNNFTPLLSDRSNNRTYQRHHQRGQLSNDYSDFSSKCNSLIYVDSKTQSIINHLHQDILSPKNQDDVYDENKKKIERSKRVDMFMKVYGNKTIETLPQASINHLLQGYEQSIKMNDELIKNDIQSQIDEVEQKIIRKKTKNQIQELNKNLNDSKLSPKIYSEQQQQQQ